MVYDYTSYVQYCRIKISGFLYFQWIQKVFNFQVIIPPTEGLDTGKQKSVGHDLRPDYKKESVGQPRIDPSTTSKPLVAKKCRGHDF